MTAVASLRRCIRGRLGNKDWEITMGLVGGKKGRWSGFGSNCGSLWHKRSINKQSTRPTRALISNVFLPPYIMHQSISFRTNSFSIPFIFAKFLGDFRHRIIKLHFVFPVNSAIRAFPSPEAVLLGHPKCWIRKPQGRSQALFPGSIIPEEEVRTPTSQILGTCHWLSVASGRPQFSSGFYQNLRR